MNAYKYFGGVTRIIQCDNLKTGVQKHGKDEVVLNKSYQELAEHYGTAILPARVRAPKDKAAVEGTVGIISTFILAALRNRQFLSVKNSMPNTKANFKNLDILINNLVSSAKLNLFKSNNLFHLYILNLIN